MILQDGFLLPQMSQEVNELFKALCLAQREMPVIAKNVSGRFKYADWTQVLEVTQPILTKHGLALSQDFIAHESGKNFIMTILCHTSGQWKESIYALPFYDRSVIAKGMSFNSSLAGDITYFKRYAYSAAIGCATGEEDNDGEPASERPQKRAAIGQEEYRVLKEKYQNDPETLTLLLQNFGKTKLSELTIAEYNLLIKE